MLRRSLVILEFVVLTALILATRCANYQDVFVDQNVYFADADCYARMSRVRICAEHPGTIVRHHDFENFPQGTTPHTTAPLDYLIVGLASLLKPFTTQPLDLAGAFISPLFALIGGWFLWWWSREMNFRYRWVLLILYGISPILVHGTQLGRPDHQSLLMLLITVGVCAEWRLNLGRSRNWSIVSGIAWGLALWVSLYEPFIVLAILFFSSLTKDRFAILRSDRRIGWLAFGGIILVGFLVERRIPGSWSIFHTNPLFQNWSRSIGELARISPFNRIWFAWAGYMIVVAPILIWLGSSKSKSMSMSKTGGEQTIPGFIVVLLSATYCLTIWQARWGYFFLSVFAIALPKLLEAIKPRLAVWIAFGLALLPVLDFWDARIWPNETELSTRIERRNESHDLRELAMMMRSDQTRAFLAPWWLSPSICYWSGQPAVAGSSHEALDGTVDVARFFVSEDPRLAREILSRRQVEWVVAYDWGRVAQDSASLLAARPSDRAVGRILDRTPGSTPAYLVLSGQNSTAKLFRFVDKL